MSLLLDALKRVEVKPSVSSAPPVPSVRATWARTAAKRIEPGAVLGDDLPARQVRQLAANVLAAFPKHGSLGLAFVTHPWSWEVSEFVSGMALALAECAGDEVLLATNGNRFGRWTNALSRVPSGSSWQAWKRCYRYVVVESDGSSNQVSFLAGADGVYLTFALSKTPRQSTKNCVARLQAAGVPILGSVLIGS